MHDRESMNDQYVQSETLNAGQQKKKKSSKNRGTIREKTVVEKKKKLTITEGAADTKTRSGFRY